MTTYTDIILQDTNGNFFVPYGFINRLGDVNITNPTQGQNLTYDAVNQVWKNTSTTATVAWGGITGTLSDQTDLQNALDSKLTSSDLANYVTTNTQQTITAQKTFNTRVNFLGAGDANAIYLSTDTRIDVNGTTNTVLGFASGTFLINNAAYNLMLRGKQTRPVYNSGSNPIALLSDIPTESTVSGWGFTKNTGTVTSVNNVEPVDGNVSLTIPTVNDATLTIQKNGTDVQTFSANASSNVTANITVPTKISDLTDDTSTNPVDKADTLTGLTSTVNELNILDGVTATASEINVLDGITATTTELNYVDGVTSSIQTQIDGKVSKSGDTMTGGLDIVSSDTNRIFNIKNTIVERNVNPSAHIYSSIGFSDKNGNPCGLLNLSKLTGGDILLLMRAYNPQNTSSQDYAELQVRVDANGNKSCSFPNTTCVDGQWVPLNQGIITTATSATGTDTLSYTVNVPNDGHNYELLVFGQVTTGNAIGNWLQLDVRTSITQVRTAYAIAQRAAQIWNSNTFIIPLGNDREIKIARSSSYTGNIQNVTVMAYRRIGTNS